MQADDHNVYLYKPSLVVRQSRLLVRILVGLIVEVWFRVAAHRSPIAQLRNFRIFRIVQTAKREPRSGHRNYIKYPNDLFRIRLGR